MLSLVLCVLSLIICFIAGRRSLVAGLAAVLGIGYLYGIIRANLPETFSHFIFDAAVLSLYLTQLPRRLSPIQRLKTQKLKLWVTFLMIWPTLLLLMPIQDTMVELVGLRGNIFLLPFLLIGSRLEEEDLYKLALWVAGFNLVAFGFACAEYIWGVPLFYPQNEVTRIIYMSRIDANNLYFRIPSTFTSAHAYAGTMVMGIPWLVVAWLQKGRPYWQRIMLSAALIAALFGVFMAGARTHALVLLLLIFIITISMLLSGRLRMVTVISWLLMMLCIGWVVSSEARLQRFTTLQDTDYVVYRVGASVNKSLLDRAMQYPLGNGLGGGGTSLPYFLQDLVRNPVIMESEYGRIVLEQGIPGLCLWIAFLLWVFTRRSRNSIDSTTLGRRLAWFACAAYFIAGATGVGMLTSIPQTCFMLLCTGWMVVRRPINAPVSVAVPNQVESKPRVLVPSSGA
jgi:hypothetical protein